MPIYKKHSYVCTCKQFMITLRPLVQNVLRTTPIHHFTLRLLETGHHHLSINVFQDTTADTALKCTKADDFKVKKLK